LGAEGRSVDGFEAGVVYGPLSVRGFAAEVSGDSFIREVDGRGVTGPYDIGLDDAELNSERIELITRDRFNPDVIITVNPQNRFQDYTPDILTGTIRFNRPVPQFDADFNPVSIRATMEPRGNDKNELYVGAEATVRMSDQFEVGLRASTVTTDNAGRDNFDLASGYLRYDGGKYGEVIAEVAVSDDEDKITGAAGRIEYHIRKDNVQAGLTYKRSDDNFTANSGTLGAGTKT